MSAHDAFERLAGAVLLGEATHAERAAFVAHAATCRFCGEVAADGEVVGERLALAMKSETWRPQQPIVERLRSQRFTRTRATVGALGWAVAFSLVLNVAVACGIGTRIGTLFPAALRSDDVAATRIELETARRPAVVAAAPAPASEITRTTRAAVVPRHARRRVGSALAAVAKKSVTPAPVPIRDDVPDVLAGIDLYGTATTRRTVARIAPPAANPAPASANRVPTSANPAPASTNATIPRCASSGDESLDVRPCLDPTGRIER